MAVTIKNQSLTIKNKEVIMTLTKFKSGNGKNESVQTRQNQSSMPSYGSEWNSLWPFSVRPFFGGDLLQDFFDDNMGIRPGNIGTTLPAVNIAETDNDLIIEVAAPGMNKKDFKVEINDNQLHIGYNKETKNETNDTNEGNHWRKEFSFESFNRTFSLPAIVESDKISASYTDGILRLAFPKKEEARKKPSRAIEIK
jgi:HSP20 family protein